MFAPGFASTLQINVVESLSRTILGESDIKRNIGASKERNDLFTSRLKICQQSWGLKLDSRQSFLICEFRN